MRSDDSTKGSVWLEGVFGACARTRTGGVSALRAGGGGLPGVMAGPEGLAGLHWPPLPGASFRGRAGR